MYYIDQINKIINNKNGKWDSSIICNGQEISLSHFIFSYAQQIEFLTDGNVSIEYTIKKITDNLDTLRFRHFKSNDDNFMYDGVSVVDKDYNYMRQSFGAQIVQDNEAKNALVIYDKNSSEAGIDFDNIEDILHTLYHEFTHIMGITKTDDSEEVEINGRIFINSKNGFNYGISTLEKMPDGNVYHNEHNKIDEGFVEYIAQLITIRVLNLEQLNNKDRYKYEVMVAKHIMEIFDESKVITTYLTNPKSLIQQLESININDKTDGLHFLGDIIQNREFISKDDAFKFVNDSLQIINNSKENNKTL